MKSVMFTVDPAPRPHSAKLVVHAAAFGLLVGLAVLAGQLLWAKLMPQSQAIDVASLPTCLSAVTAGLVAYCEARWPERTLAFLGRAAGPFLLGAVIFLSIVAAS